MARPISEPSEDQFMAAAKVFARAAQRLAPHDSDDLAVLLLCGQALELALKAPLIAAGWTTKRLIHELGHDLVAA